MLAIIIHTCKVGQWSAGLEFNLAVTSHHSFHQKAITVHLPAFIIIHIHDECILLCDGDLALGELRHIEVCLLVFEIALLDLEARIKAFAKAISYRHVSSSKQV